RHVPPPSHRRRARRSQPRGCGERARRAAPVAPRRRASELIRSASKDPPIPLAPVRFLGRGGPIAAGRLLASLGAGPLAGAQGDYEKPPVLRARDLAPPEFLKGPNFQVDENVPTDGLLATFNIKSDFGPFEARGPGMLHVRVNEIKALDALS